MKTKTKPTTIAQMRKQRDALSAQISHIERRERGKTNSLLVGKCFKFLNSYGSGDKWWLYARITKAGEYWPEAMKFQITSMKEAKVEVEDTFTGTDGYIEISREEYDAAWQSFLAHVNALSPATRATP